MFLNIQNSNKSNLLLKKETAERGFKETNDFYYFLMTNEEQNKTKI